MEFKLNDYHRNVSDEEMINDVIATAKRLNKDSITADEYTENGKFNSSSIRRRFGTWKDVLILCGLDIAGHNFKCIITKDDIVHEVNRVANIYQKDSITRKEYYVYGKYNSSTLIRRCNNSWNQVLEISGLKPVQNRNFSDEELFAEIERIWILLGRQPMSTDIKNGISKYSLQSYARRFGGWRGALEAFVSFINVDENGLLENNLSEIIEERSISSNNRIQHRTKRDINLRLRFKVMQRDNFKCCMCGASPAKDPSVELHIDHIIPWSKGGETTIDNLQTLCSKCNLGKSDLL